MAVMIHEPCLLFSILKNTIKIVSGVSVYTATNVQLTPVAVKKGDKKKGNRKTNRHANDDTDSRKRLSDEHTGKAVITNFLAIVEHLG